MRDPVDLVDDDAADTAAEPPVFVDATGRRRKIFRRVALGGGVLTIGYVAVLVAALLGAPVPSPLLIPITPLGPRPTDVATTPSDRPDQSTVTDGRPAPETGGATTPTSDGGGPVEAEEQSTTTTAALPPATTSKPVPGVEHRNSRAPETPPGKSDVTKKPRP
ncbi:hypothetical protein QRX50_28725 [Amycolatopsis carbonis]|uniref:Uncharacterized protein n=1 Tax=Amycolatopsis carbonis TaxID=715471 RepID=A0A9Y2MP17_9PSEU|nr:hypothetical protein [Amycolatopsis sp. 2-15]WIX75490.1 hypothetical protein QRX50_28725 [Amycolatopsis sp. 2-15]